jgi:hypothetical protein
MSYNPLPQPANVVVNTGIGTSAVSTANPFPTTVDNEVAVSGVANTVSVSANNPLPISLASNFTLDLFGRLKVSNPVTLFDSQHRYQIDGDFDDVVVGASSTVGIITAESTATLGIGTSAGDRVYRESKRVFSYQPGKALQVVKTFCFNPPKENLRQRAGYASTENGVYLELDGSGVYIVKTTAVTGVATTVRVAQADWNYDTFDGNGPSGITLDITKTQIMWSEYEWLGCGSIRVGFAVDGNFIIAHQFNHANLLDSVYMTTATLPLRFEIENTGVTTSPSTMKQICSTVISNGGYTKRVAETIARRTSTTTVGTSFEPLVSIRLAPGKEDAVVIPHQFAALPTSTDGDFFEIAIIRNATLTGAAWTSTYSPNAQADYSATALSGGEIIRVTYAVGADSGIFGGSAAQTIATEQEYNWDLQLGRTQAKVSDTYTLAARVLTGTGDMIGMIGFYDLT